MGATICNLNNPQFSINELRNVIGKSKNTFPGERPLLYLLHVSIRMINYHLA